MTKREVYSSSRVLLQYLPQVIMRAMVDEQRRLQQAKQSLDDMEKHKVTQVFELDVFKQLGARVKNKPPRGWRQFKRGYETLSPCALQQYAESTRRAEKHVLPLTRANALFRCDRRVVSVGTQWT